MNATEQAIANLARADEKRIEAARQRRALVGAPISVVVPALVHPTPELASKRLGTLFTPGGRQTTGAIPKIGTKALSLTFLELMELYPMGRQWWHPGLRLSELTELERRRLVNALVQRSQKSWREATCDPKGAGE